MYTIVGELTDLNQFIKAISANRFIGGKIKKQETERVYIEVLSQGVKKVSKYPVTIECNWYMKNRRKDIDNVCFAKKFILDGLVLAKVLQDDSQKYVESLRDNFYIDKDNPRIEIKIYEKKRN